MDQVVSLLCQLPRIGGTGGADARGRSPFRRVVRTAPLRRPPKDGAGADRSACAQPRLRGHGAPPTEVVRSPAAGSSRFSLATGVRRLYLARHRGSPPVTVQKRLTHVGRLLEHLVDRDKTWSTMALADIDDFLGDLAPGFGRGDVPGSV